MKICEIGKTSLFKSLGLALVLSIGTLVLASETTQADSWGSGGSWGGSGGGWSGSGGSGGSSGGGGLFGGRRPIRNLIGRISDRFHGGSHGSHGSVGSYSSFGSHGSVGSSYASHGSTGSSYASSGSVGSSYGSVGSSYGSIGLSYGSHGSSYGSVGSGYGSIGSSNISYGSPVSAPAPYSYDSAPIYDSGYSSGVIQSGAIQHGGMMDGGSIQPVQGIHMEGTSQPTDYYNAPTPPASGTSPPNPGPAGGSTSIGSEQSTVLTLNVPSDARVYINDFKTRTEGENRRYVSRNLKPGQEYFYNVKAVVVREGKEVVRNQVVSMKAGQIETVAFDFETLETALTLEVPKDAKVTLCGKSTKASGKIRHFSTNGLEKGKTWSDYTVEVTVEKNGKTIRQEKKLDLVAGQTYKLNFQLDETGEMLAVR